VVSGVEEETSGDPSWVALENARRKALAIGSDRLILGADTDVALDGDILGKPGSPEQAREFIARLAGRTHHVVGGIVLVRDGSVVASAVETTAVHFRPASSSLIDWYVARGEWQGRAGGYAIQGSGAAFVAGIEGDYLNVVGLPLARLLDLAPELLPV
jgi:septum formation protein